MNESRKEIITIDEVDVIVEVAPDVNGISLFPEYAHEEDAGFDFRANIYEPVTLLPFERKLIGTGVRVQFPSGYEIQIRPKSGLALNEGITIVNTPGTIDRGFTDEIGIILINLSQEPVIINPGQKIAQGVIKRYSKAKFVRGKVNRNTERGEGGYGSTGKF